MTHIKYQKVLAERDAAGFIGRTEELDRIFDVARSGVPRGLLLSFAPRTGATELLCQTFDKLFALPGITPVYFRFEKDEAALDAARRFGREFLTQLVAHRRVDKKILFSSLDLSELSERALPGDAEFIDEQAAWLDGRDGDVDLTVGRCFYLPAAALAAGIRTFVLIDDLHCAETAFDGEKVIEALRYIERGGAFPFILSAYRRSKVLGGFRAERSELKPLAKEDALTLIDNAATEARVRISESVRDLMFLRTGGDLAVIKGLISEAAANKMPLESYRDLANGFSASVFGGTVAKLYDELFRTACGDPVVEKKLVRLLGDTVADAGPALPIDVLQKRLGTGPELTEGVVSRLHTQEIIRSGSRRIEPVRSETCIADYLVVRNSLEVLGKPRAAVFAAFLSDFLVSAPKVMEREYRRASAIGLRDILASFDNKEVPAALFDYAAYRERYKGLSSREAEQELRNDNELLKLPRIVFSAHTDAFYNAIGLITESERSAVAVGFETGGEGAEEPIVWIAAEVESKLEANAELAEFWCDRLEMAAAMCDFERFRLWLVSPEGFDDQALGILRDRSCFSSSRRQVDLLRSRLVQRETSDTTLEEYEIVIPMGEDSEMVAARALEDIAKRHNFGAREINHIKTALVEACINAAEHSHSLDRRIHQKFVVGPDHITITVSNRGIRLIDNRNPVPPTNEGRRGWGLKLMRQLMDEVRIEQVDDGTRISMTKYLPRQKAA